MPTYEYACPQGHDFELFQRMSDRPRVKCPECGRMAVRRISGGAGLHFKGSGFYITDYGKDGKGPRNDKARESSETSTAGTAAAEGDSKAADSTKTGAEGTAGEGNKAGGEGRKAGESAKAGKARGTGKAPAKKAKSE